MKWDKYYKVKQSPIKETADGEMGKWLNVLSPKDQSLDPSTHGGEGAGGATHNG